MDQRHALPVFGTSGLTSNSGMPQGGYTSSASPTSPLLHRRHPSPAPTLSPVKAEDVQHGMNSNNNNDNNNNHHHHHRRTQIPTHPSSSYHQHQQEQSSPDPSSSTEPPKKKQKRNKPTLSCFECVERKTKVPQTSRRCTDTPMTCVRVCCNFPVGEGLTTPLVAEF